MNEAGEQNQRRTSDRAIWLIGPFPPPLHGQAIFNAAFAAHLGRLGQLRVLASGDTVAAKLVAYARLAAIALLRMRQGDVVYLSMPGQASAWLFALAIAALRLRRLRHYVHHHSFRPIVAGPLAAMRLIVKLGGARQHHILLSPIMRSRFAAIYLGGAESGRAHTLSNALLFCPAAEATPRPSRPVTIGHLSVLTREKGVDLLLATFRYAAPRCPDLRLVIAGPVADEQLGQEIHAAVTAFPGRIEYRGTVDGDSKRQFWADIDLFMLPTRLVDEAEPLVMLEGYTAGVEVMATDRGCIRERLRGSDLLLSGDAETDADRMLAVLRAAAADWPGLRADCVRHAAALRTCAQAEAAQLFAAMLAPPG